MSGKARHDHLIPKIIKLFAEFHSGLRVAERLGLSHSHVYRILRKNSIPRRPKRMK